MVELLADHSATGIELVSSHVRDLKQHGRDQVDTLQEFQVDVHVERNLPALLNFLLLLVALLHATHQETLPQQLLCSSARLNVQQSVMSIFDQALAEGTDPQLNHRPVIQDLGMGKMV